MRKILLAVGILFFCSGLFAQITQNDSDWTAKYMTLINTPEAELMARTGDIDNLNFGWPANFDPFSGNNTPSHGFPWAVDTTDPAGTDRIMVITSYTGSAPHGRDGYTNTTSRPANNVQAIKITFPRDSVLAIQSAILQIFVDDFQAPVWWASYQVYFDGVRVPFMESIINSLVQTGPIGRIISAQIPHNYLYLLQDGQLSILIDDYTTGAGDGFALDFAKILINPFNVSQTGTIQGTITKAGSGGALENEVVVANGLARDTTDAGGFYSIDSVLAGYVSVQTFLPGYGSQTQTVLLSTGQTLTLNFQLDTPAPQISSITPAPGSYELSIDTTIVVGFNSTIDTTTFNDATFILSSPDTNISGHFVRNSSGFEFFPDSPLEINTDYTITVTSGIKNEFGIGLDSDSTWMISTNMDPTGFEGGKSYHQPRLLELGQNYPNPFNPQTEIVFTLTSFQKIKLAVYNLLGQELEVLENDLLKAGLHKYTWNATQYPSGIYFYQLQSGTEQQVRKMVLMK